MATHGYLVMGQESRQGVVLDAYGRHWDVCTDKKESNKLVGSEWIICVIRPYRLTG